MSLVKVSGNASGTGTITIAAPNTNSNYQIDLPTAAGTLQLSGNPISGTTGTFSGTISGGSTVGVGGATPSASGAGVSFPATQSASTDVNTLDDYEEGTFTPALKFGGNSTSLTYSTQTGTYTKIGNQVSVLIVLSLTNKGSSTGTAAITGLPFTIGNSGIGSISLYDISFSGQVYVQGSSTSLTWYNTSTAGTRSAMTNTNFANSSEFVVSFTYLV